jgi:guanine deaminase
MSEAYKVLHLQDQSLPASRALYLATLGAARALDLDGSIGNFEVGREADFIVLDSGGSRMSAVGWPASMAGCASSRGSRCRTRRPSSG